MIERNGYETHSSIFLFTCFNRYPAQKTFLHILDNDPMKTFGSGQSSIMIKHKTKDCAELRPYSITMFTSWSAPLKIAEFHNHSPILTMVGVITLLLVFRQPFGNRSIRLIHSTCEHFSLIERATFALNSGIAAFSQTFSHHVGSAIFDCINFLLCMKSKNRK